ncbi:hypothetical protein Bca52824_077265 [Brassica carinata]|uniref:FAD/NAD(P)-binding domain-containing protein n=1 Tax=Brassica carinata TaxID=52824 RepID=A0A8X7TYF3_BRACI|nr:hypothetical protein Bca52824_077265 [Brassica carinata]
MILKNSQSQSTYHLLQPLVPSLKPYPISPLRPRVASVSNHRYYSSSRRFSVRAQNDNGADSDRHYDFDLFTIGAGSGGVRASRFATSYGASAAVCELPFPPYLPIPPVASEEHRKELDSSNKSIRTKPPKGTKKKKLRQREKRREDGFDSEANHYNLIIPISPNPLPKTPDRNQQPTIFFNLSFLPKTLSHLSSPPSPRPSVSNHRYYSSSRRFSVRAQNDNGADSDRHYDFDLFTIGAGSGGVRASRFSTSFGASAAVCELPFSTISSDTAGGVGGTCVLRGCVPKKLLVYASKFTHEFEDSRGFGWKYDTEPSHDWSTLIANKNAELQRLTGIYKNILNNANVKLIEGRGKVIDPHTIDVDGKIYTTRNILIAVGGRPFIPDIPGREFAIDSDAALDLPSKPKKIAIVGGGYIALEFAGIFNGLIIQKSQGHHQE